MAYYAGIDIGSTTSKTIVLNSERKVEAHSILRNTYNLAESGRKAFLIALGKKGLSENEISYIVSTGYGRRAIDLQNEAEPEVICHALGMLEITPQCRTIIDIGG